MPLFECSWPSWATTKCNHHQNWHIGRATKYLFNINHQNFIMVFYTFSRGKKYLSGNQYLSQVLHALNTLLLMQFSSDIKLFMPFTCKFNPFSLVSQWGVSNSTICQATRAWNLLWSFPLCISKLFNLPPFKSCFWNHKIIYIILKCNSRMKLFVSPYLISSRGSCWLANRKEHCVLFTMILHLLLLNYLKRMA